MACSTALNVGLLISLQQSSSSTNFIVMIPYYNGLVVSHEQVREQKSDSLGEIRL